jgi:UPF0042 nucleotide-binding protein
MRLVIVTGMSGSGKATALKILEDAGYFCVDNLPVSFVDKFVEVTASGNGEITKLALGIDCRIGKSLSRLEEILEHMHAQGIEYEILFLDASDEVLVKRYKETRRLHPMAESGRIEQGIHREREELAFLKKRADYIIDTSMLLVRELKQEMDKIFVQNREFKSLMITVLSFGFKYGIPSDADLVFDVRFLPNPYYYEELRKLTGNDQKIQDFVMGYDIAHEFLDKLDDMVRFLVPNYVLEGKNQLVIAIGCTGGKHRSVTLANQLYKRLQNQNDYGVKLEHRDIEKDAARGK